LSDWTAGEDEKIEARNQGAGTDLAQKFEELSPRSFWKTTSKGAVPDKGKIGLGICVSKENVNNAVGADPKTRIGWRFAVERARGTRLGDIESG